MATRTVTTLIDDLDGSEAAETISFAYRGTDYTIDLNEKNVAAFDKAIGKFVKGATREVTAKRGSSRSKGPASAAAGKRTDLAAVRAWAADNGREVSSRGRIAAEVLEAYDAAR